MVPWGSLLSVLNQLAAEFSFSTPSAPPSTYTFKLNRSYRHSEKLRRYADWKPMTCSKTKDHKGRWENLGASNLVEKRISRTLIMASALLSLHSDLTERMRCSLCLVRFRLHYVLSARQ